jgi:hypothetical protein
MKRVIEKTSTNEPYGNKFTPYRIWSDIIVDSQTNAQPFTAIDGVTYRTKAAFIAS